MSIQSEAVVLIDAENNPDLEPTRLRSQLDKRFDISEMLAFADFTKHWMRGVAQRFDKAGVTMIHVESRNGRGFKADAVDNTICQTMRRRVRGGASPSVFIIVSGDQGFADDVQTLRDLDKHVIIAANPHRMSRRLMKTVDEFVAL